MLFTEMPLLDRFEAARKSGFRAVEIQFPYEAPLDDLLAAKRAAGVDIALINFPAGDLPEGGQGLASVPGREALFEEAVRSAARYARALKPRCVNVLAGAPIGTARERCMETLAGNLRLAAETMAELGILVTTEAVNPRDRPGYFLNTTEDALAAIDFADHPNLALQYDVYHMQIVEGDLATTLETHIDRIGHMQFADVPGRAEPGTGEINFDYLFRTIDRLGFEGWVGAEYVPSADTRDTLAWFRPYRTSQRRRPRKRPDAAAAQDQGAGLVR